MINFNKIFSSAISEVKFAKPLKNASLEGVHYFPPKDNKLVRVPEADGFTKCCEAISRYDNDTVSVFGDWPSDYVTKTRYLVPEQPERYNTILKRWSKARPAHYEEEQYLKPNYFLEYLESRAKGQGTAEIKKLVSRSLADPRTKGRVVTHADIIDGKTSPAGFYYKLGFRFPNKDFNRELEQWIINGGKRQDSPMITGMMYLPKENIFHCLRYS